MGVVKLSDTYWSLVDGRDKYKWDLADSFEAGKKDGMAIGEQKGMALGRSEGIALGKSEGISETLNRLAKALGKDEAELRKCLEESEVQKEE